MPLWVAMTSVAPASKYRRISAATVSSSPAESTPWASKTARQEGMSRKNAYGRSTVARLASGSSVTTTGTIAMIRGAGRPAAALAISGTIRFESAAGPARNGIVPSASSPVTRSACRPIAATISGMSAAPATCTEAAKPLGPRADRLAVEVDSVAVEHLA